MAIYEYGRVSTDKQENSLDLQDDYNNKYCQRVLGRLSDIKLYDEDSSGKKMILKRTKGSELENLKKGDILVCMKHDRMFRNMADGVVMVEKWFNLGVSIYFGNLGDKPIDMNNPEAKLQFYILLATATYERDCIGRRTKEGMSNRKKNKKSYSSAPYGYDNIHDRNEQGDRINGRMVANDYEQKIILEMKEYRNSGISFQGIADKLNADGIPTKKKKGLWTKQAIQQILNNSLHNLSAA
jgi:site-specific DNA recombinase